MKTRNILVLIAIAIALTVASLWIGQQAYSWFPPQAAAESKIIDQLFSFLTTLGAFIFLGVTGTLMYSILFHRAGKYDFSDGPPIEGNVTLEIVWTAIPILLVFWIAGYSYNVYEQMGIQGPEEALHLHVPLNMEAAYAAPESATTQPVENIEVLAKQWAWVFRYPDKGITSTELHLKANQRVRLALQSADVLHGFYVPAFRLKQDIIPYHSLNLEFTPLRIGKYRLTDSQYSGTYFATMLADVVVESPEDYNQWQESVANHKQVLASNQAASEYTQASNKAFKPGWPTVAPASPPLVNYAKSRG